MIDFFLKKSLFAVIVKGEIDNNNIEQKSPVFIVLLSYYNY